jgi:EAL and modified HD-GYP domain-containing signal transduction protein
MSSVFVGRQPIFDRSQSVFGYELLHRSNGTVNSYTHSSGDRAVSQLVAA